MDNVDRIPNIHPSHDRPHMEGWCKQHPPERHEQQDDCVGWGPAGTFEGLIALGWPEAERGPEMYDGERREQWRDESPVKTFPQAADYIDRLADARAEYTDCPGLGEEIRVMRNAAAMLRGHPGTLCGWLPSWCWHDFGIMSS